MLIKNFSNKELFIAESTDTGSTGIPHLKRLWGKLKSADSNPINNETELDAALLDILGLGLLPTYQFFYQHQPSLQVFEQWVMGHFPDGITDDKIQECYSLWGHERDTETTNEADVLSKADLTFWEENGYVILRNAISQEDCLAARQAIWDYLKMDEHDALTWYKSDNQLQGIMVPLYRHAAIDKNRNSPRIKKAFEQLWNQQGLVVTADKCGFNPPETSTAKYKGVGLHWDVSLATPIPFGTQGILYLTDTAANQGALTVIPGFHKIIESWLPSLPPNANPRNADFTIFKPIGIAANAGDLIIWNHKLPHSSSPNTASLPRLVQYINWYCPLQKNQEVWV